MKFYDRCFIARDLGFRVLGLIILISTLTTSCCCHTCCKKKQIVAKPTTLEKVHIIPEPEVLPRETPPPGGMIPETRITPEVQIIPDAPKGELRRTSYDSVEDDFVIPFSEMCIFSKDAMEDEEEEKIDWGFITPWLYKE